MQSQLSTPPRSGGVILPILAAAVGILAVLTLMAGLPGQGELLAFTIGVLILIVLLVGLGLVGWHMLVRPLPAGVKEISQPIVSTRERQVAALVLTFATVSLALAGVWDEIWHTTYGIPFGQDFFWRPHLMLYSGFLIMIGVGGWAWWKLMRYGKGTLQQRFRANPILGVSSLAGLFTAYAVIADPLWHKFYGRDVAPWSVPHLLLIMLFIMIGLMAIAYHKSVMEPREWKITSKLHWRDVLVAIVLSGALMDFMLILTIEWYGARSSPGMLTRVMSRPDWMIGIFMAFNAMLFGTIALHATRRPGIATIMGLIAIGFRFLFQTALFDVQNGVPPRDGMPPLLFILPLLFTLDIAYAIVTRRTQQSPNFWVIAAIQTVVFAVIGLPLLTVLFVYPPVNMMTIPGLLIAGAVGSVVGTWLGQLLGDIGRYGHEAAPSEAAMPTWVNLAFYAGYVVFLIIFVVTATPPIKGG